MKERVAVCSGFIAAAAIPTLVIGLSSPIATLNGVRDWPTTIETLPYWYLYTIVLTMPIAVPMYIIAIKYRLIHWWSALIAGCVVGVVVSVLIELQCVPFLNCIKENMLNTVFLSVTGGVSGIVFWLVWRRHRPSC